MKNHVQNTALALLVLISVSAQAQFSVNIQPETCTGYNNGQVSIYCPYGNGWNLRIVSATDSTDYSVSGDDTLITGLTPDSYILRYMEKPVVPDTATSSIDSSAAPAVPNASFRSYDTLITVQAAATFAASFSASAIQVNTGDTVLFTNLTANAVTYYWNFGDTEIDSIANPIHAYSSPGNYTVALTAQNAQGCVASSSQVIEVNSPPSIQNYSHGARPEPIATTRISGLNSMIRLETETGMHVISVYTGAGQLVTVVNSNNQVTEINVPATGVYIVGVTDSEGNATSRTVLVR